MPHEYTRQRQGRDFALHERLTKASEETRRDSENARKGEDANKHCSKGWNNSKMKRNETPSRWTVMSRLNGGIWYDIQRCNRKNHAGSGKSL